MFKLYQNFELTSQRNSKRLAAHVAFFISLTSTRYAPMFRLPANVPIMCFLLHFCMLSCSCFSCYFLFIIENGSWKTYEKPENGKMEEFFQTCEKNMKNDKMTGMQKTYMKNCNMTNTRKKHRRKKKTESTPEKKRKRTGKRHEHVLPGAFESLPWLRVLMSPNLPLSHRLVPRTLKVQPAWSVCSQSHASCAVSLLF